jgi:uncharacterized protein (DUF305 family)
MALRFWLVSALLPWSAAIALGQPIVQPGAPGESSKHLSPATASTTPLGLADPDVKFMQGMIMHHSQAVEMTALMPARTHNKDLLAFGKRISISQSDEMKYMKQWLEDRGKPVEMEHDMGGMNMAGMDHSKMDHSKMDHSKMAMPPMPMMMPGMLTPEQMKALTAATGPTFDRLFLTGMIQHHGGALTMVDDLFKTPGAGQDAQLYDFATDVDNTQRAEINIMQGMLQGLSKGKK